MRAPLTAADVAALVQGRLVGDGGVRLGSVAPLDRAGPDDLSFLTSNRYLAAFAASHAGAVLIGADHAEHGGGPAVRIVVTDPSRAMLVVVRALYPEAPRRPGVDATARIGRGAVLGSAVAIGPYAVIGDGARLGDRVTVLSHAVVGDGVSVGDDAVLHPHVVCYPGTVVGARTILHAGVRLGVDGFGYVPGPGGHEKVPHVGRCVVGDDVEIGGNTVIDRGSVDDTVVGNGTKIDNLAHIAHNVRIGARCLIMGQVGIAGSTHLEDEVIVAGQAGLTGHITLGRGARVVAQGGVIGDVAPGVTVSGFPARPHREVMRAASALHRLADIVGDLEKLVARDRPRS